MDIEFLRSELERHRGQWTRIAEAGGLNRKTIERLMSDRAYNPTLATINAIWGGIAAIRATTERAA